MISFRVSEREFELLKAQSDARGADTVSEFARLVLCSSDQRLLAPVSNDIQQITKEVHQLQDDVRRVTDLLVAFMAHVDRLEEERRSVTA